MTTTNEPLADFLAAPPRIGTEISVTGKWIPATPGGRFRPSPDSPQMLTEWEAIHAEAKSHDGVLATELNHAVGEDAMLVHHVFCDADALVAYFDTTASEHRAALMQVATPELHMVRGVDLSDDARQAIEATGVRTANGEWIYGYVRDDYRRPDPAMAVQVTAKWTGLSGGDHLDELRHWWQHVGTDAHSMEPGLLRFEAYQVPNEQALVIHETFEDSAALRFHLTKGTAAKYKQHIDAIAAPEEYYFRGPVAWTIRTYSKFMHLPATYSSRGLHHEQAGGTYSDGLTPTA